MESGNRDNAGASTSSGCGSSSGAGPSHAGGLCGGAGPSTAHGGAGGLYDSSDSASSSSCASPREADSRGFGSPSCGASARLEAKLAAAESGLTLTRMRRQMEDGAAEPGPGLASTSAASFPAIRRPELPSAPRALPTLGASDDEWAVGGAGPSAAPPALRHPTPPGLMCTDSEGDASDAPSTSGSEEDDGDESETDDEDEDDEDALARAVEEEYYDEDEAVEDDDYYDETDDGGHPLGFDDLDCAVDELTGEMCAADVSAIVLERMMALLPSSTLTAPSLRRGPDAIDAAAAEARAAAAATARRRGAPPAVPLDAAARREQTARADFVTTLMQSMLAPGGFPAP